MGLRPMWTLWGSPLRRLGAALAAGLSASAAGRPAELFPKDNTVDAFRNEPGKFLADWHESRCPTPPCVKSNMSYPLVPMDIVPYSVWLNGEIVIPGSVGPPTSYLIDLMYPFEFETLYKGGGGPQLTRQLWWMSYAASAAYLVLLWAGQSWMKERGAFDLKGPLAAWNLFLAVFSICGALRMVPQLILLLWLHGVQYSVCRGAYYTVGNGASGLWMLLFVWSKYVELIDTLFLVLRKKKVGFLHWYHHFSVLLYTWHAFGWESPTGIWFAAMNYTVHALMYSYYFLAAVCSRPPKWALLVTCLQISQMFVGSAVAVVHLVSLTTHRVPNCDGHLPNVYAAIAMYASYFLLFLEFLVKRFCIKRPRAKKQD